MICSTVQDERAQAVRDRVAPALERVGDDARGCTRVGLRGLCNFIVGDTVEREVFIVNLQTKEIVSSPEQLEEAADYCDDVFFLPSPHTHSELESFAAASAGLQLKAES